MESNIVAKSNVYLTREDNPWFDREFVSHVMDYDFLKKYADRHKYAPHIPLLSSEQMRIVHRGIRCVYAKNDPCIGPVKGGGIRCKCINKGCPGLYDGAKPGWKGCNPGLTEDYVKQWTPNPEDKTLYANPKNLRRYYIVDMVSDEEMSRYESNPMDDGYYPIPVNPVSSDPDSKGSGDIKIDPETGKKMVVIGYRWVITDNASYENEQLLPIWGFVDEANETEESVVRRKAKRIQKKQDTEQEKIIGKKIRGGEDPDYERKEEFEKAVASAIISEIKLTDVDAEIIGDDEELVVLLDNPAELAFVSSTFLVSAIPHGIETDHSIKLALIDDFTNYTNWENVMISNTALKRGCRKTNVQAWKALSKRDEITQLHVAERDFYKFEYGDQISRWTCRNMYGVTHVCVDREDICEMDSLTDGIYPVSLVDDRSTYMILDKSGEVLGRLGESFVDMIDALKQAEEISGTPATINGISLLVKNGKTDFLGMGHLKFIEY